MLGALGSGEHAAAALARSASSIGHRAAGQGLSVEVANAYAQLAFHGLTHLPLRGPHSLYDTRYIAWSRASLPLDAREPLAEDAGRIATQVELLGAGLALQWLPKLHTSLRSFTRSAPFELNELAAADDIDSEALGALQSSDPRATEWLRSDLLLAAASFQAPSMSRANCAEVESLLLTVEVAERPESVALVHALGARGRVLGDAIFVGAPAVWSGVTPAMSAVIALHEHAVRGSRGDFVRREWAALKRVSQTLRDGHQVLHEAHAEWLAMTDLTALVEGAVALNLVHVDGAQALLGARDRSLAFAKLNRA